MKNIVWLASYPKSGNTWFRAFLTCLLNENTAELDINGLERTPIASARPLFEDHTGLESSELTFDEIELLRPYVYMKLSEESAETRMYMKVHDAFTKTFENIWMFPPETAFGAIYFIRNPLDVAVSFSYHSSREVDVTIKNMNDAGCALSKSKRDCPDQLKQKLLTWSGHVESWIYAPVKACILRYEDMLFDSFNTFKKAIIFLELNKSDEQIRQAIVNSSFDKLRKQEEKSGFREKPQKAEYFFREGKPGTWKKYLNSDQKCRIVNDHQAIMWKFGYLDDSGEPIF